jgi:hypothetical protein
MGHPEFVRVKGQVYRLAVKDDPDDKADKKKKKTTKETKPSALGNVRLRHEGIQFYINVLFRSKDAGAIPFARKIKSIPDSVNLTADQLDLALAAKKMDELWHIYVEDQGWFWKGDDRSTKSVADIQRVLDWLEKYRQREQDGGRVPVIYAVVTNKIIGK